MGANAVFFGGVFLAILGAAVALQCYQCGMYNDGVGSITPCLNETHMKLTDCPKRDHNYCIKYISEGSTVLDCVHKCKEQENLPGLREVHLYRNELKEINLEWFAGTDNVEAIFIGQNEISKIRKRLLEAFPKLRVLDLSFNELTIIHKDSFANSAIKELILSHNNISNMEKSAFRNLYALAKLKLDHNSLNNLVEGVFVNIPTNVSVDLQGNTIDSVGNISELIVLN